MIIKRPKPRIEIPLSTKKVFSGKIFDVYQWKQQLTDGSSKTYEMLKRVDTVNVLSITKDKKIIVTKQTQSGMKGYYFYGLPGGMFERGENLLEASERELIEETQLLAGKYKFWYSIQPVGKMDWAIYTVVAYDLKFVDYENPDKGETIELIEFTFEEFIDLITKPVFRDKEILVKLIQELGRGFDSQDLEELFSGLPEIDKTTKYE